FKIAITPAEATERQAREVSAEDAGGAFSIADVPVGEVGLVATAGGYAAKRADVTVAADAEAPEPEMELALAPEAPIAGRVTSEAKAPVPEGRVAGRYTINASAEGKGKAKVEDVDVERAGSLRLVLERGSTAVLTGTVVGLPADEEPGFVAVTVIGDQGEPAQGMVDAAHSFRIEDAPAGRVQARANATYMSGTERSSRAVDLILAAGSET